MFFFSFFSVEWLTDRTQSKTKSCKIGLTYKFMFEVITTKLSYQTNLHFQQVVAKTRGRQIKIPTFFKTEFIGGPSIFGDRLFR